MVHIIDSVKYINKQYSNLQQQQIEDICIQVILKIGNVHKIIFYFIAKVITVRKSGEVQFIFYLVRFKLNTDNVLNKNFKKLIHYDNLTIFFYIFIIILKLINLLDR